MIGLGCSNLFRAKIQPAQTVPSPRFFRLVFSGEHTLKACKEWTAYGAIMWVIISGFSRFQYGNYFSVLPRLRYYPFLNDQGIDQPVLVRGPSLGRNSGSSPSHSVDLLDVRFLTAYTSLMVISLVTSHEFVQLLPNVSFVLFIIVTVEDLNDFLCHLVFWKSAEEFLYFFAGLSESHRFQTLLTVIV